MLEVDIDTVPAPGVAVGVPVSPVLVVAPVGLVVGASVVAVVGASVVAVVAVVG